MPRASWTLGRWTEGLRPWLVFALLATLAAPAGAQRTKYKSDQVDQSLAKRGAIVRRFLQNGDGDEQEFRDYISKYYFPAMTQATPEALGGLGRMTSDLFKNYLYKATGPNQKYLSKQARDFAVGVIRERRYHPTVRFNAFLILGRLDDKYSSDEPVPSVKANDALCGLAMRALKDGRYPRYELTAALTGLKRHTRFLAGLPPKQKSQTLKTLYTVLKTDNLAGDYDDGVREWVYLQAAEGMASLRTAGKGGVFALTIGKRMADESLSLETRAELASLLGELKANPGAFDAAPLVKAVLKLASEVTERESKFATAFEDLEIGGQAGRGAITADRALFAKRVREGENRESELIREGIVGLLADLRTGVRAVNSLAGEAGQASLTQVSEAIDGALETSIEKKSTDLAIADAINKMAAQVKAAAAPVLAPPAEGAAAE